MIATINPATGETVQTFPPFTADEIEQRLALAAAAARQHRGTSFAERAQRLHRAGELLTSERKTFGELMTLEMGKPLGAAIAEAEKCALVCHYYADRAEQMLAPEAVAMDDGENSIVFQPLGVVLAVMPWNFPFWQVFRFAAPALMAGNVGLLKHASNVPQCALAIEEIFRNAGFVDGAFQTLLIGSDAVESVITDHRVAAVTLTGSEGAGSAVGTAAGRVLKKTVFELGGSDPFVVMPSADVVRAAETAVKARMINNGQSCIAAKRFIVHKDIYDEFVRRFVDGVQKLHVGDPMQEKTDIGPLATRDIVETVERQVRESVAKGARVAIGGERMPGAGNYYTPTVLVDVPLDSAAAVEEVFGPVAPIFRVDDIDAAIRLANATPYGLGSAAWTNDGGEQTRFVDELEAGTVTINGMVVSDPHLPFGGVKRSGYGRELSAFGIREFVNVKAVRKFVVGAVTPGEKHVAE